MSVVDAILQRYGMKWELNPYRIVNKYGVVVQKKMFDLRDETLKGQENRTNTGYKFKKGYPSITDNI